MRAICIGECMVELRDAGQGLYGRGFAGDAYNTAVYLKRSAPQVEVSLMTATGDGSLSAAMRAAWAAEGVGADLAFEVSGAEPGLYMIELDAAGDRSFHYWRGASPARGWLRELAQAGGGERLAGAGLVFLTGVSLAVLPEVERAEAVSMLAALKGRVGRIAFDANIRPALWRDKDAARAAIAPMLRVADMVRFSRDDAAWLFGAGGARGQIEALQAAGVRELVLTLDAEGCLLVADGAQTALPAPPTTVRDTSGAGDSFNGAYLAARLQGAQPREAARAGLEVASRVVTWSGAIVPADISHPRAM